MQEPTTVYVNFGRRHNATPPNNSLTKFWHTVAAKWLCDFMDMSYQYVEENVNLA